jgi:hypothetical protein
METKLTLAEFEALLESKRQREHQERKFLAALKGIEMDDPKEDDAPTFEEIQQRATAKINGISEEELAFAQIGIAIEGDE